MKQKQKATANKRHKVSEAVTYPLRTQAEKGSILNKIKRLFFYTMGMVCLIDPEVQNIFRSIDFMVYIPGSPKTGVGMFVLMV